MAFLNTDLSHVGTVIAISGTFSTNSNPYPLSAFPKDTNPFEVTNNAIADMEIGTNGNGITWKSGVPIEASLSIIPTTPDYYLLLSIYKRHNILNGTSGVVTNLLRYDELSMVVLAPNSRTVYLGGVMTEAPPSLTLLSEGKYQTAVFKFKFSRVV